MEMGLEPRGSGRSGGRGGGCSGSSGNEDLRLVMAATRGQVSTKKTIRGWRNYSENLFS